MTVTLKSRVANSERATKLWSTGGRWPANSIRVLEPTDWVPDLSVSASSTWSL